MNKTRSHFLKWVLAAGIVIVLNMLFNYTIQLFYESPDWQNYCPQEQVTVTPTTQEMCVAEGGAWTQNTYPEPKSVDINGGPVTGYCDINFTCAKEYSTAQESYNLNVFIILVMLGVLAVGASFFVKEYEAVSLGLSLGGVVSFIIGSIRYWTSAPSIVKVLILAAALAVLVYLGIKKINE
jgi:hypothetical protein